MVKNKIITNYNMYALTFEVVATLQAFSSCSSLSICLINSEFDLGFKVSLSEL
jgi:hypothetical protein